MRAFVVVLGGAAAAEACLVVGVFSELACSFSFLVAIVENNCGYIRGVCCIYTDGAAQMHTRHP